VIEKTIDRTFRYNARREIDYQKPAPVFVCGIEKILIELTEIVQVL